MGLWCCQPWPVRAMWVKFLHVGEQELWIRAAGKVTPCEAAGTGLVVLRGSQAHSSKPSQLQRHGYRKGQNGKVNTVPPFCFQRQH